MNDHKQHNDPALTIAVNQPSALSALEQQRLNALLQHCVQPAAISIDALMTVQQTRGWISDQTLAAIALFIGVSEADLDSVATFYNLIFRLPVAKIVLHPCNGMACQLLGSDEVEAQISHCLDISPGQSDRDNNFTLVPLPCLGACDKAPVMIADKTLFELINIEQVPQILAALSERQILAKDSEGRSNHE